MIIPYFSPLLFIFFSFHLKKRRRRKGFFFLSLLPLSSPIYSSLPSVPLFPLFFTPELFPLSFPFLSFPFLFRLAFLLLAVGHLEALGSLKDVLTFSESAGADEALSGRAKPTTGGGDDVALLKDLGENVPRGLAREPHPDVRGVIPSEDRKAHLLERLSEDTGVLLVEVNQTHHGLVALGLEAGQAARLDDVGGAVEAGGHDAVPVLVDGRAVGVLELLRTHGPPETDSGESGILGEGAGFDSNLVSSGDFENGLRAIWV
mmetsp:Transcript_11020/g.20021  ORF Transcript_11020/g.20021 Transcript_11020/m.20021 type:complete len:261 (+) Transcript_11020:165-947(+)